MCVLVARVVSDSAESELLSHQAPLSMGFSKQEYWNELPFPTPVDLPNPGTEPGSLTLQADSLPSEPPGKPNKGSSWEWKQLWLKIGNQSGVGPHHSWTAWPSANLWSLWSPQGYLGIFQRLQIRHLILEVLHSKRKPFSSNSLITVSKPSMWLLAGYQCICDWEGFQDMGLSELKWESEVKWKSLSCVQSVLTPWTIQSMEFSRQEYWSG